MSRRAMGKGGAQERFFGMLTGRTEQHLVPVGRGPHRLHREVLAPFLKLQARALKAGHEIAINSSFRSFERQLGIWNAKATGQRQLLDDRGLPLEYARLSPEEVVWAILRWSALPGASRHHWGTDLDVFDAKALPRPDYQVQLTPQEVDPGGMFAPFHEWLDAEMQAGRAFGFYRPYARDQGGVAPERWHLSFAPLACELMERLTLELFIRSLEESGLELKQQVLEHALRIYAEYVVNVQAP